MAHACSQCKNLINTTRFHNYIAYFLVCTFFFRNLCAQCAIYMSIILLPAPKYWRHFAEDWRLFKNVTLPPISSHGSLWNFDIALTQQL